MRASIILAIAVTIPLCFESAPRDGKRHDDRKSGAGEDPSRRVPPEAAAQATSAAAPRCTGGNWTAGRTDDRASVTGIAGPPWLGA